MPRKRRPGRGLGYFSRWGSRDSDPSSPESCEDRRGPWLEPETGREAGPGPRGGPWATLTLAGRPLDGIPVNKPACTPTLMLTPRFEVDRQVPAMREERRCLLPEAPLQVTATTGQEDGITAKQGWSPSSSRTPVGPRVMQNTLSQVGPTSLALMGRRTNNSHSIIRAWVSRPHTHAGTP